MYLECLEGVENRLLWISGNPGSGKTILSTRIRQDINQRSNLLLLFFNFKASEQDLASSAEGLLRGLLHQILVYEPSLFATVLPLLRSGRDDKNPRFLTGVTRLNTAFQRCIEQVQGLRVLLLVDALDECNSASIALVIDLLQSMIRSVFVGKAIRSVIVTSRRTELIQFRFKDSLTFDLHALNDQDINAYVDLRAKKLNELYPQHGSVIEELISIIKEHASGIFLWVVLVLDGLEKEAIEGTRVENLIDELTSVPSGLDGLYENMLERVFDAPQSDIEESCLIFRLAILATRPLHLVEVWAALQVHNRTSDPAENFAQYDSEVVTRWVRARTGGLLEVINVQKEQTYVVPIHLSVYNFLISDKTPPTSYEGQPSPATRNFKVYAIEHAVIAKICVRYLWFRRQLDLMETAFYRTGIAVPGAKEPFPYAFQQWEYHSEQAEKYGACMYDSFVELAMYHKHEDHSTLAWYNLGDERGNRFRTLEAVAARYKLSMTLKRLIDNGIDLKMQRLLDSDPCLAACQGNNLEGLQRLCSIRGLEPDLEAIGTAGEYGYVEIVKFILDQQPDPARNKAFLYKAMHEAAAGRDPEHNEDLVRFLIEERGADVNGPAGGSGGVETALQHAAWAGRDVIAEILLIGGADPNLRGESGLRQPSALHRALHSGSDRIVRLLLDYGADVNAVYTYWGTPLMCAGNFGRNEMAKLLLKRGADPNKQSGSHGNALQRAASRGNFQIATALIDAGANINAVGGRYHTALQAAAYGGNPSIVSLLIERGADVNIEGGEYYYKSPLNAAADSHDCKMLRMLIDAGATVPPSRPFYSKRNRRRNQSALHAALRHRNFEAITLLLDHGASITMGDAVEVLTTASLMRDNILYKTLLSKCEMGISFDRLLIKIIQIWGETRTTEEDEWAQELLLMIVTEGANPNATGPFKGAVQPLGQSYKKDLPEGSALQHAAARRNKKIVESLLSWGADVNLLTDSGTPLQVACELGDIEMVRLLLHHGANANSVIPRHGSHLQAVASIRCNLERPALEEKTKNAASIPDTIAQLRTAPIGPPKEVEAENAEGISHLLLDYGADPRYKGGELGSALHAAASALNQPLLELLLDRGADVNVVAGSYGSVLQAVISAREFETHRIEYRDVRAEQAKMAIASLLIRKGATVNSECGEFHTALQAAAWATKSKALLLLLLRHKANVNANGGRFGTALQAAAASRNHEHVLLLLQRGADVNLHGGVYGSPLTAVLNKYCFPYHIQHRENISTLLKHGANPNFVHQELGTPLHLAAEFEDAESCRMLIAAGADVNLRAGQRLYSLLAIAQKFSEEPRWWSVETLRLFLEAGADVHCQTEQGCTALHLAASAKSLEACDLLLQYGAIINARCDCHRSVLDAAVKNYGKAHLLAFLIDKGADVDALEEDQLEAIREADVRTGGFHNLASRLAATRP
ncbi:MAG: hypothetical protein Q9227_004900 [Pyrenula ochraceoflavens]